MYSMKKLAFIIVFLISCAYSQLLSIYAGKNNHTFIGYLNAKKSNEYSIWNRYGDYGSKYSDYSIWNRYGDYGSVYGDYSPFAKYSEAPIIKDETGHFYGYFTINENHSQRSTHPLVILILNNYEEIREDVGGWYEKIFEND